MTLNNKRLFIYLLIFNPVKRTFTLGKEKWEATATNEAASIALETKVLLQDLQVFSRLSKSNVFFQTGLSKVRKTQV